MSGRRRTSGRGVDRQSDQGSARAADLDEQSLLGNQALTSRMHGGPPDDESLNTARDLALPLLDRGCLALEVESVGDRALRRFREIVSSSQLDRAARSSVLGTIETNEAVARDVSEAVRAAFGEDSPEVRDQLSRDLDAVGSALRTGEATSGSFQLADGRVVDPPEHGSRAGNLVVAVADAVLEAGSGTRILAFCQRAQLAMMFDEEEEEIPSEYELG